MRRAFRRTDIDTVGHRQAVRKTDEKTARHRQTYREKVRQIDSQRDCPAQTDGETDKYTCRRTDGRTDRLD